MLDNTILVKTAAGRLEIDERKLKIGARQRMVLISINGERTIESIRTQFIAINDISALLDELMGLGLVEIADATLALETGAAAALPDFSPPGSRLPRRLPSLSKSPSPSRSWQRMLPATMVMCRRVNT